MKSSTIFLRDETGQAYGAFCINFDISALVGFRNLLGDFVTTEDQAEVTELLSDDIYKTIQEILAETIYELDKELPIMSREDKIALIARLDTKGVFRVKKAVPILADQLGLSRATVYNYLSEARNHQNNTAE
jgi:predicted transcriptional regulator YheO